MGRWASGDGRGGERDRDADDVGDPVGRVRDEREAAGQPGGDDVRPEGDESHDQDDRKVPAVAAGGRARGGGQRGLRGCGRKRGRRRHPADCMDSGRDGRPGFDRHDDWPQAGSVMSTTRRGGSARNLLSLALVVAFLGACAPTPVPLPSGDTPSPGATGDAAVSGGPTVTPGPTPGPPPGHELYGFLPYWEMDDAIADHLAKTPLTTLALFSVTDTSKGALNTRQTGYKRITGEPGTRVIREAHDRGVRVDLVFTSFGAARNRALFANEARQDVPTIAALVALVGSLGLDGICVDIEGLDPLSLPEYGSFVRRLREAVVAADAGDRVTVSTSAGGLGAAMAAAAVTAGADRVFLMGYDYRVAGSSPGATSPLDRSDGDRDLPWSIDLYAAAGVPPERTLLGAPAVRHDLARGISRRGCPRDRAGRGVDPRRHLDILADVSIVLLREPQEMVEVYLFGSDGSVGAPPQEPSGPHRRARRNRPAPGHRTRRFRMVTCPGPRCTWTCRPRSPQDGAGDRQRVRGRRVLGHRVRARPARLHGADGAVRGGRAPRVAADPSRDRHHHHVRPDRPHQDGLRRARDGGRAGGDGRAGRRGSVRDPGRHPHPDGRRQRTGPASRAMIRPWISKRLPTHPTPCRRAP